MAQELITNCPNCGGVLAEKDGYLNCKYCGTTIYDFATLDVEKPFYMRVKTRQGVILSKVRCVTAEMQMTTYSPCFYDETGMHRIMRGLGYQTLTMTFDVLQAEKRGDTND